MNQTILKKVRTTSLNPLCTAKISDRTAQTAVSVPPNGVVTASARALTADVREGVRGGARARAGAVAAAVRILVELHESRGRMARGTWRWRYPRLVAESAAQSIFSRGCSSSMPEHCRSSNRLRHIDTCVRPDST